MVARGSKRIAKIVPLHDGGKRELGFLDYEVPEDFDAPLPEDELEAWE